MMPEVSQTKGSDVGQAQLQGHPDGNSFEAASASEKWKAPKDRRKQASKISVRSGTLVHTQVGTPQSAASTTCLPEAPVFTKTGSPAPLERRAEKKKKRSKVSAGNMRGCAEPALVRVHSDPVKGKDKNNAESAETSSPSNAPGRTPGGLLHTKTTGTLMEAAAKKFAVDETDSMIRGTSSLGSASAPVVQSVNTQSDDFSASLDPNTTSVIGTKSSLPVSTSVQVDGLALTGSKAGPLTESKGHGTSPKQHFSLASTDKLGQQSKNFGNVRAGQDNEPEHSLWDHRKCTNSRSFSETESSCLPLDVKGQSSQPEARSTQQRADSSALSAESPAEICGGGDVQSLPTGSSNKASLGAKEENPHLLRKASRVKAAKSSVAAPVLDEGVRQFTEVLGVSSASRLSKTYSLPSQKNGTKSLETLGKKPVGTTLGNQLYEAATNKPQASAQAVESTKHPFETGQSLSRGPEHTPCDTEHAAAVVTNVDTLVHKPIPATSRISSRLPTMPTPSRQSGVNPLAKM
ncbi:hypothetical protein, conserved [Eimeria necatrix]|uniref:Uncharacterized protein n=1 Tax=Eimeria necatrix TaxID=51315 RepID=U6MJM7_9EIME|nr:hypothetical protein, conserved [Eimeria necatrix]CDJ62649.1 hypothetical protein, conserved [Eimeria necatrix]